MSQWFTLMVEGSPSSTLSRRGYERRLGWGMGGPSIRRAHS
jgi:hypothetical protein